jgi:hypothetical protein
LYNIIRGWVGSRADLDTTKKRKILPLPAIQPQPSSPQPRHFTDLAVNDNIAAVPKNIASKAYRGIELKLYSFKLFELDEDEGSASLSGRRKKYPMFI